MSKKNKTDFIDEDEFLSAVSQNKKGGCVRMGKPPQEKDETPHDEEHGEESISEAPDEQGPKELPPKSKEGNEKKKTERQRGQDGTLARLKSSKEKLKFLNTGCRAKFLGASWSYV